MEHVLLTGFPGFLAENLVRRCREDHRDIFWHLLVLPRELPKATHRLRDLGLTVADYAIYPGDVTMPDLGLPGRDAAELQGTIQRCFHLAAMNDLTASADACQAVNVRGTVRVLEFLTHCEKLAGFNYLSTCYISGTIDGPIWEDDLPEPEEFYNDFERTKHEAERAVRSYLERLPTTIFRVSTVLGDSQSGETNRFAGPCALIRCLRNSRHTVYRMPNLGSDSTWLNTVPVDFVTTVMRDVGFSDAFVGKTLQVADPAPPTTLEAFEAFYRQTTGRKPLAIEEKWRERSLRAMHHFPLDLITGIPGQALDYFDHRGQYRTENLRAACRKLQIKIPRWRDVYKPIVRFATTEHRDAPNAGVVRAFRRWCLSFRFIYAVVGLLFLVAPDWIVWLLTLMDDENAAIVMLSDNLLWRSLSISFIVALFVAITFLEIYPFHKPLHILIIGAKFTSTILFFGYAVMTGLPSLVVCGLIDGSIAVMHRLFYRRLRDIRPMTGSAFQWDPYHLLFPRRFLTWFAESMAPKLDDPPDVRLVVDNVRAEVGRFPPLNRYMFVFACYYISVLMPMLRGFPPFVLMSPERQLEFLKDTQHVRSVVLKMPLIFLKLVVTAHLYDQKPYLRSIGAE